MKMKSMDFARKCSLKLVKSHGGSSNMEKGMVLEEVYMMNNQIIIGRIIATESKNKMMNSIEGNLKMAQKLVMDTISIKTAMNMMAHGFLTKEMERESSKRPQQERSKEYSIIWIKW